MKNDEKFNARFGIEKIVALKSRLMFGNQNYQRSTSNSQKRFHFHD